MRGYNHITLVGNLTKDPELRTVNGDKSVCTVSIAVNSSKDRVLFIDIVTWDKQAETCARYLSKGRQVLVNGELIIRSWETDGETRYKTEINANPYQGVQFLGGSDVPKEKTVEEPF
jgi:single-strand DNA-binding protein